VPLAAHGRWRLSLVLCRRILGIDSDSITARKEGSVISKRLHGQEYEATGIGLAMCQKIVERNGDASGLESERGKGSTIFFTLRARDRQP
jgi:light-regulated signal transduction histidine kinase (bacteriophytochrome)